MGKRRHPFEKHYPPDLVARLRARRRTCQDQLCSCDREISYDDYLRTRREAVVEAPVAKVQAR